MDPVQGPFRPGAGRRPPLLAGREQLLDAFDVVRDRASTLGEGDRAWMLTGLQGVGKTALLNELLRRVSGEGWIAAKVEVTPTTTLPEALATALVRAMRTATGRHPVPRLRRLLGVFKAFSMQISPAGTLSLGAEVSPVRGVADSGRFAHDLAMLFEVLGETSLDLGIGTLILIHELQEASSEELTAINTAVHQIGQGESPLPIFFLGAGLPSLPAQLAEATSYAERLYDYRTIGLLDPAAASAALAGPSAQQHVDWSPEALDAALAIAEGYPYFLQAVGKHVWDVSPRSPISLDDVEVGSTFARREVDEGLYLSRWERATPAQRDFIRVIAALGQGGHVGIADAAAEMGKRPADLSVARRELISKGLLYAPQRGLLAFTVPGMHAFIAEQD